MGRGCELELIMNLPGRCPSESRELEIHVMVSFTYQCARIFGLSLKINWKNIEKEQDII